DTVQPTSHSKVKTWLRAALTLPAANSVWEALIPRQAQARIAGGDHISADLAQISAGIDGHFPKPGIDQPDVGHALAIVFLQLFHGPGHAVVFRENLNGQESSVQLVLRFWGGEQHAHIGKPV